MTSMPASREGLPISEAFQFEDLITYASGSVISKILMKQPSGSLTLFSFDADEVISETTVPSDILMQVLEGEVEFDLQGEVVIARAPEAVLVPAHTPHAVRSLTQLKLLQTMIG